MILRRGFFLKCGTTWHVNILYRTPHVKALDSQRQRVTETERKCKKKRTLDWFRSFFYFWRLVADFVWGRRSCVRTAHRLMTWKLGGRIGSGCVSRISAPKEKRVQLHPADPLDHSMERGETPPGGAEGGDFKQHKSSDVWDHRLVLLFVCPVISLSLLDLSAVRPPGIFFSVTRAIKEFRVEEHVSFSTIIGRRECICNWSRLFHVAGPASTASVIDLFHFKEAI